MSKIANMNSITKELLNLISDGEIDFENSAYNIREDGGCAGRQSSKNISIVPKTDNPGIEIHIKPNTIGETVYIPACVTHSGVEDLVYNDFYVGENSDVVIVAGCGIHSDGHSESSHNGIHRFFVGKNAHVVYKEKHIGVGEGDGQRRIDPVTYVALDEDSVLEMDTTQISGVDSTVRKTSGTVGARAKLLITERIMTDGNETAYTDFSVTMDGEDSACDLISRSVAKDNSHQEFRSVIKGNTRCTGHSECDAILVGNGTVSAAPELFAGNIDAALIHEAAIGKIAGEQILKLRTLGLTEEEAEEKIIEGFLVG